MKIAVWILPDYKQQIGGGFALYDKFIRLIDQYEFSPELEVCFVGFNPASNYQFKKKYIHLNLFGSVPGLKDFAARFSHRIPYFNNKLISILNEENVSLVFYPIQGYRKIVNFPFVASNWDIGHKASYAFPELGMNYSFDYREKWFSRDIFKALSVFAESEAGKDELMHFTRLFPSRVKIVPLFPGGVVDLKVDKAKQLSLISKLNLQEKKYFFYPAQFWAHKNHFNLIKAFEIVANEFPDVKLVLTGSDKGNKNYIRSVVEKSSLKDRVVFPGFIDNESMVSVYSNAAAMIMPSFLGPTNMPLMEAQCLNCPVLCSDLPGHREIMMDGALYFNPADALEMAGQMKKMMNDAIRNELLQKSSQVLKTSVFTPENALKALNKNFLELTPVRNTWGKSDKIF
ncbi:MAG: glycosyltransferase family 1 protein [Bacteroidia bacterium]